MIREIKNLEALEKAFENGLKNESLVCLVYEDGEFNGVLIGRGEHNKETFLTTVEENFGMIERRLYKIKNDGIDYRGPLDAKPEDVERIERLKDELFKKYYGETKK